LKNKRGLSAGGGSATDNNSSATRSPHVNCQEEASPLPVQSSTEPAEQQRPSLAKKRRVAVSESTTQKASPGKAEGDAPLASSESSPSSASAAISHNAKASLATRGQQKCNHPGAAVQEPPQVVGWDGVVMEAPGITGDTASGEEEEEEEEKGVRESLQGEKRIEDESGRGVSGRSGSTDKATFVVAPSQETQFVRSQSC
jgi:hypothetical protein